MAYNACLVEAAVSAGSEKAGCGVEASDTDNLVQVGRTLIDCWTRLV